MKPEKSTVDEIRARFDVDVERFSNLETGQSATIDAPLMLELVAQAAAATATQPAGTMRVLDIGCGAGNYTLKLLEELPGLGVTLVDLSRPMLDRAQQRVAAAGGREIELQQGDIRELELGENRHDIVLAAMVLHHLRSEAEWDAVLAKLARTLRPGGSLWIADMVKHDDPAIDALMDQRYTAHLTALGGAAYCEKVRAYIEREDTPWAVEFQSAALARAGFTRVQVLHKNACFAALAEFCPELRRRGDNRGYREPIKKRQQPRPRIKRPRRGRDGR